MQTQCSLPLRDSGLLRGALALTAITLAGFGLLYSLAGVGLGQALFAGQANGSLIERDGRLLGSSLVAQPFVAEHYFQPRPSSAGYDVLALAGSNQARSNPQLQAGLAQRREQIAAREGVPPERVPDELFSRSGSGIDPHVSPQAIRIQLARVALARGVGRDTLEALLQRHIESRQLGFLGQPRVNVLELNLALDALAPPPTE